MKTRIYLLVFLLCVSVFPQQVRAGGPGKEAALADSTAVLRVIGIQGAVVLYNTHMLIGSLADGYLNNATDPAAVTTLMKEQVTSMGHLCEQYQALINSGCINDPIDSAALVRMKQAACLLKDEAQLFLDFVNEPTDTRKDAFFTGRITAWKEIADLLGIE